MKLASILLLSGSLAAFAATEEKLNKQFAVQSGGTLIVDVDFGTIEVGTNATSEVTVDVWRKITRKSTADEEEFLQKHPVQFSQDGATVTIRSRNIDRSARGWSWNGKNRAEAKYTILVPAKFSAQLKTSGGGIAVSDLEGSVKANTSGGGLKFTRLHGPLDGDTSGGGIRVADCEGQQKVHTSGGGIEVTGGSGSLEGETSGGSVTVKNFKGPASVETSGGGITLENIAGNVNGSTSGGSISAAIVAPLPGEVNLSTSGGGVTVKASSDAAFDLDASTSGGSVSTDLPVTVVGKVARNNIKGPVNGGGKPVVLRTSGGSIHVKKL